MDNADHRIKKKNLSPRVITIYAKWTAIQLNRIHFLIPPKIFIWKQKTLRVQTLVQLHISNAFKRCFLSRKENNFHDFHMTVWEQFYTQSDLSHKALPYASWYFLISLFFYVLFCTLDKQVIRWKKIAFDLLFRLTDSSFVFI